MVWVALRAPRGRMQEDATKAMPGRIGEERRRRRRPRAAARPPGVRGTARSPASDPGGWPFARDAFQVRHLLHEESLQRRELQKARHDAPHPFFSSLLDTQ